MRNVRRPELLDYGPWRAALCDRSDSLIDLNIANSARGS